MGQDRKNETNFIFTLAQSAAANIAEGYYRDLGEEPKPEAHRSLKDAILNSKYTALIAEIKFTSPAEGKLRPVGDVKSIARAYESGGVAGISVLTEPKHFEGDIRYIPLVKKFVKVPVLMKDIVIDPVQIDAAAKVGADAILLIAAIFMNHLAKANLEDMCALAHTRGLEVLLEAHTENEFMFALDSGADLIGINNRNLDTLEVSLETSKTLMAVGKDQLQRLYMAGKHKPIISESGLRAKKEIDELRSLGIDGFLVGSALMKSRDIQKKVKQLTGK
jgi:indole-3-glycerol phosphate synthase